MAGTQIQRRRGTTAEHATFTGAVGEVTIDTTKKTTVVHDGATAGGLPQAREDLSNITIASLTAKTTPVDADLALIGDSAAANAPKKLTFANLWVWIQSKLASPGAIGGTTPAEVTGTNITATGNLLANGASSLVGYGTGAGGTVTQATSKSTAVTLNKPTGRITMNAEALAANTAVGFNLTNSLIAAADVVLVSVAAGYATDYSYRCWSEGTATTNRRIVIENRTAGSLSEAVVLNFAIIKGAST